MHTDPLSLLSTLALWPQGPAAYYRALTTASDPVARFAGWCQVIDLGLMGQGDSDAILALCGYGAMRSRAFAVFSRRYDYDLAVTIAATPVPDVEAALMLANISRDPAALEEAFVARFYAEPKPVALLEAAGSAEALRGWQGRVEMLCRAIVVAPQEEAAATQLAAYLVDIDQLDLARRWLNWLGTSALHPNLAISLAAQIAFAEQRFDDCLAELARLEKAVRALGPEARLHPASLRLLGRAREAKGDYRPALRAFAEMHALDMPQFGDRTAFMAQTARLNALAVPTGLAPARPDRGLLLGFPRSGTGLLGRALAYHPDIETITESGTLNRTRRFLAAHVVRGAVPLAAFSAAAALYTEEITRLARKGSRITLDTNPMLSASAPMLAGLVPGHRSIFTIRHPYDVVLSAYRYRFPRSPAAAGLQTVSDAVRTYDQAMSAWFSSHTLVDPSVHYVRYEALVTSFRDTIERSLTFLGLTWSDALFSNPALTTDRSGLALGVQSSWEHYTFAFGADDLAILGRWCDHFGYAHL
jgi:tetratricopeptide (TPR) repeat protein